MEQQIGVYYHSLPERVPVHFGGGGKPDAWADRSFASVMLMPVMTFFMGPAIAFIGYLTAHAKRAIRIGDGGVSVAAQGRFRRVISTFLSGVMSLFPNA